MNATRIIIFACFVLLLGVPMVFRPSSLEEIPPRGEALPLIIITPHNEQIRYEFKRAFESWHQRNFKQAVNVIYNVPGGTSEIRKMLESQYLAAIESGNQPGGDADLVFGGGSFEHGRLKRGVRISSDRYEPISQPVPFTDEWLLHTFGENKIGDDVLFDPDHHWFGTALSGFGIVFNNDLLRELAVSSPGEWEDLCNPKLQGWISLVNPNQSGSVTTAFESLLKRKGWAEGWRILRRAGANTRYFSASSLKPPMDVSQGNAAMGVCIDFFGRFQSQALREAGDPDRIGYIDPPGGTLDADPVSMLRNAPQPELAQRFIEFCLGEEGQALWQFPRRASTTNERLGPDRFELRRLPIIRSMYQSHFERFIDQVNPFELALPPKYPDPNFRDFLAPVFAAMVMDNHHDLVLAWKAINADSTSDEKRREMLVLLDAMPSIATPDGTHRSLASADHLAEIRNGWLRGAWSSHGLWHPEASPADEMRKQCGRFFRDNYRRIVRLAEK